MLSYPRSKSGAVRFGNFPEDERRSHPISVITHSLARHCARRVPEMTPKWLKTNLAFFSILFSRNQRARARYRQVPIATPKRRYFYLDQQPHFRSEVTELHNTLPDRDSGGVMELYTRTNRTNFSGS